MKFHLAALVLVTAALGAAVYAEIPNVPKDKLQAGASHIIVGKVRLIAAEEENEGKFMHRTGVAEIQVSEVEKGEKIEAGDAVYARFWTQTWIGKGNPPPFGSGHHLPKKGDTVRVYLHTKDGGYDATLPNGFEVLTKPGAPKDKP